MAERLTLDQAAHRLRLSARTVRRRVKDGTLRAEREATAQGFRYWVLLDTEPASGVDSESKAAGQAAQEAAESTLVVQLREENQRLWTLVETQQRTIDRLAQQVDRDQLLIAQAQRLAELPAAGQGDGQVSTPGAAASRPPGSQAVPRRRPRSRWERLLEALRSP
jgi:hypothetical protein